MATLKWYDQAKKWETFFHGAFTRFFLDIRNIKTALNNAAKATRVRFRRDKNLSEIPDAAAGRTNLELINDCSALARAPHHHDARYIPKIEEEIARAKAAEDEIQAMIDAFNNCTCTHKDDDDGGGGGDGGGAGSSETGNAPLPPSGGETISFSDNSLHMLCGASTGTGSSGSHMVASFQENSTWDWYFNSDWEGNGTIVIEMSLSSDHGHHAEDRWKVNGGFAMMLLAGSTLSVGAINPGQKATTSGSIRVTKGDNCINCHLRAYNGSVGSGDCGFDHAEIRIVRTS